MNKTIQAVYRKGVFKPSRKLNLAENKHVTLQLVNIDDLPAKGISRLASKSPAFDFLNDKREDIYSIKDGKPV